MNKLLVMTMAAAMAAGAYAADPVKGTEGFEGTWPGSDNLWAGTSGGTITAYAEGAAPEGAGEKYLKVETDTAALARNLAAGDPVAMGAAMVESLVQFTATDSAPELEEGAKFALWLKETAPETEGDEPTYTLMVTCGKVNDSGETAVANVALNCEIAPETWHKVGIVPCLCNAEQGFGAFLVVIDDTVVAAADQVALIDSYLIEEGLLSGDDLTNYNAGKLFPSLIEMGVTGGTNMAQVLFNGTGAIDNVTIKDVEIPGPGPGPEPEPVVLTITPGANSAVGTVTIGGEVVTTPPATVAPGTEVVVTFTANEGYQFAEGEGTVTMIAVEGEALTITGPNATAIPVPDVIKGASKEQQTEYAAWAEANGVKGSTTDKLAEAFALGVTGANETAVLAAAEQKLKELIKKINLTALANGSLTDALAALNAEYPYATFSLEAVPQTEIETTAMLYRLKVVFKGLAK